MKIAVVSSDSALARLLNHPSPDVLVLWERIRQAEALNIAKANPASYTVSGEWRGKEIWGVIRKGPATILEYRKIMDDDAYDGFEDGYGQNTIHWDIQGKIAICVLVCRDVDVPDFTSRQLANLASAPCIHRILAIPAHMSGDYFHNAAMDRVYCGITVALSNGRQEDGAIPSFISSRVDGARDGFPAVTPGFIYAALPDNHQRIPIDSVLHRFSASVRGAPFRWSPKGADAVKEECERLIISMAFTDTEDYPCVDLQNRRIEIPVYYLENLWCMCFAGVVLPVYLRTRADEFGTVIQFPQSGDEGAACKLLQWATERMVNGDRLPWPDTVRPDIDAVVGTAMNTANVLFEIAIGFILHHELAHILHDLRVDSADPHNRRRDESLADQIAAAAYVLQNDPDTKKHESRCLGIALAFLDMVGVAIFTVDRLRKSGQPIPNGIRGIGDADHPSSITRLRTFMDDSYFDGTGHCHEICQVMLRLFCTILGLGGIPKKIPSREAGWRKDLALLEEHVMRD